MPDFDRARAVKIATIALNLAMAGDLPEAAKYVERLNGNQGLVVAIIAWCDTYIARTGLGAPEGETPAVRMAWLNTDTGEVQDADQAPQNAVWAGRLVAARAANDEAGFYALLRAPTEGAQLGDAIIALLQSVAIGLNDPERIRAAAEEASR